MRDEYFSRRAVSHVIMQSRDSKRHIFIVVWTGKKMISLLFTIIFFSPGKKSARNSSQKREISWTPGNFIVFPIAMKIIPLFFIYLCIFFYKTRKAFEISLVNGKLHRYHADVSGQLPGIVGFLLQDVRLVVFSYGGCR